MRYIQMAVSEARQARVPQQLLSPTEEGGTDDEEEGVNEFSTVGAIMGVTAPLGVSADDLRRRRRGSKQG